MSHPSPLTKTEIVDRYFLEHRAKLLDIAAFLDRIDRASGGEQTDFRIEALLECAKDLHSGEVGRTERMLLLLSDKTTEPIDEAGMKGATGAVPPQS